MKTRHFRELFAALAVAAGTPAVFSGQLVYGQGPAYYAGAGLTGSAYPIGAPAGSQLSLGSAPVGSGVPHLAQEQSQLPGPQGSGHVHVPPADYGQPVPSQPGYGQQLPYAQPAYPSVGQQNQPHAAAQPIAPSAGGDCLTCGPGLGQQPSQIIDQAAVAASCGPAGCGIAPALNVVAPNPWIFGANALLFERIGGEHVRFASDSNMPTYEMLGTKGVDFGTAGGYEVFGGRYFGCGKYALMASYWSIFPDSQLQRAVPDGGRNVRSNIPFTSRGHLSSGTLYGLEVPGAHMYDRYNGTQVQRLVRDQDFQNFELNVYSFALGGAARAGVAPACSPCDPCGVPACSGPTGGCAPIFGARCSPLRFAFLGGFRWFRFDDDLEYAASMGDTLYGPTIDDVYYRNGVTNDLYGFQLGGNAIYCTGRRISLLAGSKFGVFCNDISYSSFAGHDDGTAATILSGGTHYGQPYSFTTSDTDVALLGEGNLGLGVCITRGWSATVGYRILGISGIATAPGQVPRDFGLYDDVRKIDRSSSLILHGLTLGGVYNW